MCVLLRGGRTEHYFQDILFVCHKKGYWLTPERAAFLNPFLTEGLIESEPFDTWGKIMKNNKVNKKILN